MKSRLGVIALLAAASILADRSVAAPPAPSVAATTEASRAPRGTAAQRNSPPGFRSFVDMQTFMDHVLTPAATVVWRSNGFINDSSGDHDLSPKTDADWELVVSGAATLAEATNALRIPERAVDALWNGYVDRLADAAERAYQAAEKHDLPTLSGISDHLDEICSSCHRHYGYE